jgi:hypothetical protein
MFYETIKDRDPSVFKRLTGVSPEVFALMLEVVGGDARLP